MSNNPKNQKEKPEKESLDPKVYNQFLQEVYINNVRLKSLTVSDANNNVGPNLAVDLKFVCKDYSINHEGMEAYPSFRVEVTGAEDNEVAFRISADFAIVYTIKNVNSYDEECFQIFLDKNVPLNIWPYGRELLSSLTTRLGFGALVIEPLKG